MANNITLEPGGPRLPSAQEQVHIREALGAAAGSDLDATNVALANLSATAATAVDLDATNDVVDSLVASKDLELMDETRVYEVGEAFHYDGRNFRCDVQAAIGETPDTDPGKFSEIGATPTGPLIKALYELETKAFTDPQFDKLALIESGATADQTGLEIKTAYEAQTNAFTDPQFIKLAGIEELADVTDTANVDAAGAVMNSDTDVTGMAFGINEDTMVSALSTKFPTQSSVKNYVDTVAVSAKSYQGGYDADTNIPNLDNPPTLINVAKGDVWDVTAPGQFFSIEVEAGDTIRATKNTPTLESDWVIVQGNLTAASIKSQYESNGDTNALTDSNLAKLTNITATSPVNLDTINADSHTHANQGVLDNVEVPYLLDEAIKLGGVEDNATADQTGVEILAAVESESGRTLATDGAKLDGIENNATADQTGAEIKTAYEAQTKAFTDPQFDKLDLIEANADKTDATNVIASLSGATITTVPVDVLDKVTIQDVSDADSLKTITVQSIVDAVSADSEQTTYGLRDTTTDAATTTRLSTAALGSYLTIAPSSALCYTIKVTAYNTTDGIAAAWHIRGAIRRNAADSTVLIGNTIEELFSEGIMNGCVVTVSADDTNEALDVSVNGLPGKTVEWSATVEATAAGL